MIPLRSLKTLGSLITHICLFREKTFFIPASSKRAVNVIPSPEISFDEVERADNVHNTSSSASDETSDVELRQIKFKASIMRLVTRGCRRFNRVLKCLRMLFLSFSDNKGRHSFKASRTYKTCWAPLVPSPAFAFAPPASSKNLSSRFLTPSLADANSEDF